MRRKKNTISGRDHYCQICNKCYLSYPALYTHKRNKHNIIPITGKPEIFKQTSTQNKFKYNAFENNANIYAISSDLIKLFSDFCIEMYLEDKEGIFYNPNFKIENDKLIKALSFYQQPDLRKIKIPKPEDELANSFYKILAVYLILLMEITKGKDFSDFVIKFVFFFREFLNLNGWGHYQNLKEYEIINIPISKEEFCDKVNCEEIPEMVNDFTNTFLEISPKLSKNANKIIDITQNFCSWLFINDFTKFKLMKIDEEMLIDN